MSSKTLTRRSRASREPLQMMEEDARCELQERLKRSANECRSRSIR
jgi:hypothetical protein